MLCYCGIYSVAMFQNEDRRSENCGDFSLLTCLSLSLAVYPHQNFSAPGAVPSRVLCQGRRDGDGLPDKKSCNPLFGLLCLGKLIPILKTGADACHGTMLHLRSAIQTIHSGTPPLFCASSFHLTG